MTQPVAASLWIKPAGPARNRCREACERARARHGGPHFEPHVTLLGSIALPADEAARRLQQLAQRLQPFELRLNGIGRGHTHFHRLFAEVELTPPLRDARRFAEELFGAAAGAYEPHLSLVYGDAELPATATQGFDELVGLTFPVESLHLVAAATGTPVADWRVLAERTLRPESGAE